MKKIKKLLTMIVVFLAMFVMTFEILKYSEKFKQNLSNINMIAVPTTELSGYSTYVENVNGKYIGNVINDNFEGSGQFQFLSGEIYVGNWTKSKMSGDGKMIFEGIGTYDGEYLDSKREGNGVFTWDNGDKYDGHWSNDKIDGNGKYSFASGAKLIGKFSENKIVQGTYTITSDSYTIERTIENGILLNKYHVILFSGDSFDGSFNNGQLSGYGILHYSNGDFYSGNFENGMRNGIGTYEWKNGVRYIGSWQSDVMSGDGIYYYNKNSGDYPRLEGTFTDGKPNGKCNYYETSNVQYETQWENGQCIKVEEIR